MKSSDISKDVVDYLESKRANPQKENIDAVAEPFILQRMKPELTAEWWRFFLGNRGQPQKTFFVMGQMLKPYDRRIHETESLIEREKMIVIPIDNWISICPKKLFSDRKKVEKVLHQLAIERMDRVTQLQLWIDDQPTKPEPRIISSLFEIEVNNDNLQTLETLEVGSVKPGKYFTLSDGYWLFLEPYSLAHGHHIIQTFGSCATGVLELQMKHRLHII